MPTRVSAREAEHLVLATTCIRGLSETGSNRRRLEVGDSSSHSSRQGGAVGEEGRIPIVRRWVGRTQIWSATFGNEAWSDQELRDFSGWRVQIQFGIGRRMKIITREK